MANSSNVCTIFSYFSILQLTSAFQTMLDWILDELLQKKHMIFHSATKEQGYRVTIIFFGRDVMGRIIDNCMMKYFATWILLAIASYTKLQLCLNSEMLKKQVAYLLMYCHEAMSIYDLFWPFLAHFWRFFACASNAMQSNQSLPGKGHHLVADVFVCTKKRSNSKQKHTEI